MNCWTDFSDAQGIVWRSLKRSPIILAVIVVLVVFESATDGAASRFAGFIDSLVLLGLGLRVVKDAWSHLTGAERPDPRFDFDRMWSAVGNGIVYNICGGLGLLCFMAPGIFVAVAGSLGLVLIAVEGRTGPDAFQKSMELMKGHWKFAAKYLVPTVLVLGVGFFLLGFGLILGAGVVETMMQPEGAAPQGDSPFMTALSIIVGIFVGLWVDWFLLCQMVLQVKLYRYLKGDILIPEMR